VTQDAQSPGPWLDGEQRERAAQGGLQVRVVGADVLHRASQLLTPVRRRAQGSLTTSTRTEVGA